MKSVPFWFLALAATPLCIGADLAQDRDSYDLSWHTVDGGGEMWITGGDYELSGTIGQPDAGVVMTGGVYELTGGFWVSAVFTPPICVGDLNCDGAVGFADINPFVLALSNPAAYAATYPNCPLGNRDIDGDGVFGFGDINPFVALLSAGGGPCP